MITKPQNGISIHVTTLEMMWSSDRINRPRLVLNEIQRVKHDPDHVARNGASGLIRSCIIVRGVMGWMIVYGGLCAYVEDIA